LAIDAAKELDSLLGSFTAKAPVEKFDAAIWGQLQRDGWLDAGRDMGGERFDVLDLAELATAWGRNLIPGPFLQTLIARRYTQGIDSPAGLTFSLVSGAGALVPFGGLQGCTFLSRLDTSGGEKGTLSGPNDEFAETLPLTTAARGTAVAPQLAH